MSLQACWVPWTVTYTYVVYREDSHAGHIYHLFFHKSLGSCYQNLPGIFLAALQPTLYEACPLRLVKHQALAT